MGEEDRKTRRGARLLLLLATLPLVALALLSLSAFVLLDAALEAEGMEQTLDESEVERLLDDLEAVLGAGLWTVPSTGDSDAADALGPYVAVDADPDVPADAPEDFGGWELVRSSDWKSDPAGVGDAEAPFWAALERFDHLDIANSGAWSRWLRDGGTPWGPGAGKPSLAGLEAAAAVRLARGLSQTLPLAQVRRDVQRLALLLGTDPHPEAKLSALRVVRLDQQAAARANRMGLGAGEPGLLTPELRRVHGRVYRGLRMVLHGRAPPGTWARLEAAGVARLGMTCGLATEVVDRERLRRALVRDRLPFERTTEGFHAEGLAVLEGCRLPGALEAARRGPPMSPVEVRESARHLPSRFYRYLRVPYLRSTYARYVLRGFLFSTARPYHD